MHMNGYSAFSKKSEINAKLSKYPGNKIFFLKKRSAIKTSGLNLPK